MHGTPDPDDASYILLMALCAVSCQTVTLNAVFDETLLEGLVDYDSDKYYSEAVSKIPAHIHESQDLDYLRSFGLLAVYALRQGDHSDHHRYLGLCHALMGQMGFHDEGRWPNDLPLEEIDDRRRLFWCIYRLEVHSACVFGHLVRMPESQISVLYPRITPAMDLETHAWTAGWDYITDLFRLLEYAIFSIRGHQNRKSVFSVLCERPSPTTLFDSFTRLKAKKSPILLKLERQHIRFQSNRCKYIAAQVASTETLIHIMTLLYCQAPAREVIEVATKFLEELSNLPLIMFKVASNQIVQQLLGIGHMLHNACRYDNGPYRSEGRRLIAFLGDLVQSLHPDIPSAAGAAERLLALADTAIHD